MNTNSSDDEFKMRLQLLKARREAAQLAERVQDVELEMERAKSDNQQLHGSIAFGLGRALIDALSSPKQLLMLPLRLLRLAMATRERRGTSAPPPQPREESASQDDPCQAGRSAAPVSLCPAPDNPVHLSTLRIAAVLDTFSAESLAPDCDLLLLRADSWSEQMLEFQPHLLLVESCWHGPGRTWEGLVSTCSDALRSLVMSCRQAGIQTVFWNKEDPLHYEAFLESAALFDVVFTTDADCIPRYKRDFGHERVYLMPFALQPRVFHPITEQTREHAFFFAGAYYPHLVERSRDFRMLADALGLVGPVHIYDRNYDQGAGSTLKYPPAYRDMLRGGVSYADIADLYRSYRFGINVNTVKQSPTMFARRIFELIGCGCGVFGNYSAGVSRLLGELVLAADDDEEAFRVAWSEFRSDVDAAAYRRVAALRKVLLQHTYAHRLTYLAEKAGYVLAGPKLPKVVAIARVQDAKELASILDSFGRQRLGGDLLLLDVPESLRPGLPARATVLQREDLETDVRSRLAGYWVAPMDPRDHYGEHYLQDLMLATRYSDATAIGKASYRCHGGNNHLDFPSEYRRVPCLAPRRMVIAAEECTDTLGGLLASIGSGDRILPNAIAIDSFSYLEGGACVDAGRKEPQFDEGMDMADVLRLAENVTAAPSAHASDVIDPRLLVDALRCGVVPIGTSVDLRRGRMELCAKLPASRNEVLQSRPISPSEIERDGCVRMCVQASPDPAISYSLDMLDAGGVVLARVGLPARVAVVERAPPGVKGYRFNVRLQGTLTRYVDDVWLGAPAPQPLFLPGAKRLLVVTNIYPRLDRPYRNAFVHRRVLEYRRRGVAVDVVCVAEGMESSTYQFEGVQVNVCTPSVLRETLKVSGHDTIAVHFLNEGIWNAIRDAATDARVVVWLHGAEVQPYSRRAFNYASDIERDAAMRESSARMEFWQRLLRAPPSGLQLVFVSGTFAQQTFEDLETGFPMSRWHIIHNPIQDNVFSYTEKPTSARLNILSVRPHDSRIYANDLVAEVVRALSRYPEFSLLKIRLVGDGALFDANFAGLDAFSNVLIERRLLRQHELAELYRDYGIFLVPTRGDTQGVSRDEAMASGLVPVTNRVGSVAEFVDSGVAILVAAEDVDGMVAGIRQLIADPQLYQQMSKAAADRVRRQSGVASVIDKELAVLGLLSPVGGT